MSVRARIATLWRTGRRLSVGRGRGIGKGHPMVCAVCGSPASDWAYDSYRSNGALVIDGYAVCIQHQEARESRAG
jgi:hypothetical protein